MKKQFIKIIAPLLALLIVTSLAAFPAPVIAQSTTNQEKTMYFMENMLPIDLSKYTITLQNEYVIDGIPALSETVHSINRKITSITYQLNSEESELTVSFLIEKGVIWSCTIYTIEGQVIASNQYSSQLVAIKTFLEKYQTYAKIDSNDLITMLNSIDTTKESTIITTENAKLTTQNFYDLGTYKTVFYWTYTIDRVDYTSLELVFDKNGNFISIIDTRVLYTIGDTSINVSQDEAIAIALEKLQLYSYEMPDGSVVKDFKVGDVAAMLYTHPMDYVDYVLRPYWEVKLFLKETAPGNVFGITVFIWANTGEIISCSNMASGGINYPDSTNPTDNSTAPTSNSNTLIISIAIVAVIAVVTTGILVTKKKQK
ncbi:MAG: hypothetical protein FWC33_00165 [Candidatus Bathyarchaeota archaeon]|nr:hypothetical protein [Candidatus Termiticorpusculum sp.]